MRVLKVSWRFIVGAALWVSAALILYAFLAPSPPYLSRGQMQQASHAEYRPGGSRCDPARLNRLKGREATVERDRCQEAAEEHRLKAEDLVQQTRSAEASESVADLTFEQSQMMAAGTAIGFLTLVAAVYAVLYARRAAEEARRSSNAAEGQLRQAARVTAAELRPYLFIDRIEMATKEGDSHWRYGVTIFLKNYGKIPARMVRVRSHCYFSDDLAQLSKEVLRKRIISIPVVAPGHERKAFDGTLVWAEDQAKFDDGTGEIILRVRYSYKGDAKERFRDEADFVYDKSSIDGGHFYILSETARKRRQKHKLELLEWLERREKAAREGEAGDEEE
jgi:hypothetical protein